ncbi:MAG TPA: L-idonate 5-dehydrogenase [Streptosporangiaceae bacterium]
MSHQADIRALRVHSRDDLRLDHDPPPVAGPDEALVDVAYGGVCGSDLHYWRDGAVGTSVLQAPMVLGHEVVGRVAVPAADGSGPPAGQAVAIHPARSCGQCPWCTSGRANLCPETRYLGSAAQVPHTDGGFADQIAVPAARLIPLPDPLDLRRASLAEPAGIAWHALDRAEAVGAPIAGAHVLVVGGGPIGLLVAAVARYRDAASVTVADVQDRPLAVAHELGVDAIHARDLRDGADPFWSDNSKKLEPPDIVVESSGTVAGLGSAIRAARPGGTVVAVGQVPAGDIAVPASLCIARELTLTGSLRLIELEHAVAFLADPRAVVDPIVSDVFPADQAAEAFAVAGDAARSSKVLLDFSR